MGNITPKEAGEILSHYTDLGYGIVIEGDDTSKIKQALSLASKTLASGTAQAVVVDCKNCDGYEAGYSAGVRDTERPQGEWVAIEPYTHKTFCPFCKEDTRFEVGKYDNFCPNCGADMRKGGTE